MITFAQAETLKKELTDRYVIVQEGVAELRRFQGKTGKVKTVNMSGRALVEFDGSEDIGWYDIDPSFLKVVTAPVSKKEATQEKAKTPVADKKPAAKPAGKSPLEMARAQGAAGAAAPASGKKLSPLEMARQQGAAGTAKPPAAKAESAVPAQKKLSPLELARQQGAAGAAKASPTSDAPAASKPAAPTGKKLSPLELARQQGAAGSGGAKATSPKVEAPTPVEVEEETAAEAAPVEEAVAEAPQSDSATGGGTAKTPGSTAEIIALARQQGPVK